MIALAQYLQGCMYMVRGSRRLRDPISCAKRLRDTFPPGPLPNDPKLRGPNVRPSPPSYAVNLRDELTRHASQRYRRRRAWHGEPDD